MGLFGSRAGFWSASLYNWAEVYSYVATWLAALFPAGSFHHRKRHCFFLRTVKNSFAGVIGQTFLLELYSTSETLTTHTHASLWPHANPTHRSIFEDWTDKSSSRLTKSPQMLSCRRERRLPLKAQKLLKSWEIHSHEESKSGHELLGNWTNCVQAGTYMHARNAFLTCG
jgi:hypothetical protein